MISGAPPQNISRRALIRPDFRSTGVSAAAGVTVLFGPSGSGKTLMLDSIAGFVRPDEGRIFSTTTSCSTAPPEFICRRRRAIAATCSRTTHCFRT